MSAFSVDTWPTDDASIRRWRGSQQTGSANDDTFITLLATLSLSKYTCKCMPCLVHFFPVSLRQCKNYWNRLRFDRIAVKCTLLRFMNHGKNVGFDFSTVRCAHKSGDVINFIIVACRISSRLKWYKNYKNRLRSAKVIVKNKMSRFLWFTVYITL